MEIAPPSTRTTLPDSLGTRLRRTTDDGVEDVLEVRTDLAAAGTFEFPLRERVLRLAGFQHRAFVQVHRVERAPGRHAALAVVSDAADGVLLGDVLTAAAARGVTVPATWALDVLRQLVDATAAMHATARDVSHGGLTPACILIGAGGEILIRDYVFGAALEQLGYSSDQYWTELGIPTNPDAPGVDQRLDLFQIGLLGLQLLGESVSQATLARAARQRAASTVSVSGAAGPLVADARRWLARMLQVDAPFTSALDAQSDLAALLARHSSISAPISDLREWLPAAVPHDRLSRDTPASASTSDRPPSISRFPVVPAPSIDSDPAETRTAPADFTGAHFDQRFERLPPTTPIASSDADTSRTAPVFQIASATPASFRFTLRGTYPAIGLVALVVAAVVALYVPINGRDTRSSAPTPAAAPLAPQHDDPAATASETQATTGSVGDANASAPTGTLQIRTQPAGVQVSVDGMKAGRSPVTLNVAPGEHGIEVSSDGTVVRDVVVVQRDGTTSVIIPLRAASRAETAAAPVATVASAAAGTPAATGWVGITSPIDVEVYEGDQLIGTRDTRRLLLPIGSHQLEIVNREVGYDARRTVNVTPGKLTQVTVEVAPGTLAINALPWADVWLDGQSLGPTPIGNVKASVGTHEVIFRHPKLGEQRRAVVVALSGITRMSVDMGGK
jgi:PEGA domain